MVKTILFVGFHPSFSRHGITRASSVLLIWLNENVRILYLFAKFMEFENTISYSLSSPDKPLCLSDDPFFCAISLTF